MIVEIAVGIVLLIALSALVLFLRSSPRLWNPGPQNRDDEGPEGLKRPEGPERPGGGTDCPLCGGHLAPGVRVHSALYPGREFDVMRIYGCPHCRPGRPDSMIQGRMTRGASGGWPCEGGPQPRRCPCCRENLPESGYVLAQVYRKNGRKTHVHVVGCSSCRPGRG